MLSTALILLSLAVTLGIVLALWHLRGDGRRPGPPWPVGVVHGVLGATGLVALVLLLQGPQRGEALGVGSFGAVAAGLFAAAIAAGLLVPWMARRHRLFAAMVIAVHASMAISAYVLFLAWTSMG